jgi:hypothetical protein
MNFRLLTKAFVLTLCLSLPVIAVETAEAGASLCAEAFVGTPSSQLSEQARFTAMIAELDSILTGNGGPDADRQIDRLLSGQVLATLRRITDVMNSEDRMIDDLVQGRRTLKNIETLREFSKSISEYQQLRSSQAGLAIRLKKLLPKIAERRARELEKAIPSQAAVLQGLITETERDLELLFAVRDATDVHLSETKAQISLIDKLIAHLEKTQAEIINGNPLRASLYGHVLGVAREQKSNLEQMSLTASNSIKSMDKVASDLSPLPKKIEQQLYVVLPRVAQVTNTPRIQSTLAHAPEASDKSDVTLPALAQLGQSESAAFNQRLKLFESAVDPKLAMNAFKQLLELQQPQLVDVILKAFARKDGLNYVDTFMSLQTDKRSTLDLNSVHDALIEMVLSEKKLSVERAKALLAYFKNHAVNIRQKSAISNIFLNTKIGEINRLTAIDLLTQSPDLAILERCSLALKDEKDLAFVETVRAKLVLLRDTLAAQGGEARVFADALNRGIEQANSAQSQVELDTNLSILLDAATAVKQNAGWSDAKLPKSIDLTIESHPHPRRGEIVFKTLRALLTKKLFLAGEDTSIHLNDLAARLSGAVSYNPLEKSNLQLHEIAALISPSDKYWRLSAMKGVIRLAMNEKVEGLRALLDQKIAESKPGMYQILLITMRLIQDRQIGPDGLTAGYEQILNEDKFKSLKGEYYNDISHYGIGLAEDMFVGNVYTDEPSKLYLLKIASKSRSMSATRIRYLNEGLVGFRLNAVLGPLVGEIYSTHGYGMYSTGTGTTVIALGMENRIPKTYDVYRNRDKKDNPAFSDNLEKYLDGLLEKYDTRN